jgi:hypothetical protein
MKKEKKSHTVVIILKSNIKIHTVVIILKSNIKIVGRSKFDTSNTQIHDHLLSWLGTGTSIKSCWVRLVL